MRLIVAGSRPPAKVRASNAALHQWYRENQLLFATGIGKFENWMEAAGLDWPQVEIVSGCATGFDRMAINFAKGAGVDLKEMPADWETHGMSAGPIRNQEMLNYARFGKDWGLLAYWDGQSSGTRHMIHIAGSSPTLGKFFHVERF